MLFYTKNNVHIIVLITQEKLNKSLFFLLGKERLNSYQVFKGIYDPNTVRMTVALADLLAPKSMILIFI